MEGKRSRVGSRIFPHVFRALCLTLFNQGVSQSNPEKSFAPDYQGYNRNTESVGTSLYSKYGTSKGNLKQLFDNYLVNKVRFNILNHIEMRIQLHAYLQ